MMGAPMMMRAPMMIVVSEGVMMASTASIKLAMVNGSAAPIGACSRRDVVSKPDKPMQGTEEKPGEV
jgi:hypothetical protein